MEALIATRDSGQFNDGDIIEAFSLNRILLANAQGLVLPRFYPINEVTGLRASGSALENVTALLHRYKFTRTGQATVNRLDQDTGEVDELDYQYINVEEFLRRRFQNADHKIFGLPGNEVWYGKRRAEVDAGLIWDRLEEDSDHRRADYSTWNLSDLERSRFLPISLTGKRDTPGGQVDVILSDPTVNEHRGTYEILDGNEEDGTPIYKTLAARRYSVPYWDLTESLDINVDLVRTETRVVDARVTTDIPHLDASVIDKGQ